MGLYDFTIYDIISRNSKIFPYNEAFIFRKNRLNYKEYKNYCDLLANGLFKIGIKKGDRLAIMAQNSLEYVILYGAASKIGAIVLPLNWRLNQKEIEYILKDCEPKAVFAENKYTDIFSIASKKISFLKYFYCLENNNNESMFKSIETLYLEDDLSIENDVSSKDGFVILYTAAVDGFPKGALLSHENLVLGNIMMINQFKLDTNDTYLCILPFCHGITLATYLAVMHAGGKIVIEKKFDPEKALSLIDTEKCTTLSNYAPVLQRLMDKYEEDKIFDISSLRNIYGIDNEKNIKRFQKIATKAKYWIGYGQQEAMRISFCPFDEKPGSAGRPSPLSRIALIDYEGNEVETGTTAEICVRSPLVFLGYWNREKETKYTQRNNWHHTGDSGRFDENGYLWYEGRMTERELIKPGGENVFPAEIETAILKHEAVKEVCVFGVYDSEWGEVPKAVCVLKEGYSPEPKELIDLVCSLIASYKKPKYIEFVDHLPKNDRGEIDREKIKKNYKAKY